MLIVTAVIVGGVPLTGTTAKATAGTTLPSPPGAAEWTEPVFHVFHFLNADHIFNLICGYGFAVLNGFIGARLAIPS
ncbi:MAG: hypothetical protein ACREV4_03525 [Gammaproteobacteria bacterium]